MHYSDIQYFAETVDNSVTSIGRNAFENCSNLTSVTIGNSVTTIGEYAFKYCHRLTAVTIPNSVTSIEGEAFDHCTGLKSVVIGSSVTNIGYCAFWGCAFLTSITCKATVPPSLGGNSYVFYNVPKTIPFYIPAQSIDAYKGVGQWNDFTNIHSLSIKTLVDGNTFDQSENEYYDEISYTRTFNNTKLQALYVPFSMNYEDWKENFDVYRINAVHQYDTDDDGIEDQTEVEVFKMKSGSTEPNTPYMIRAKTIGKKTITVTDVTLYKTEENSFDVNSWNTKFTFRGTYSGIDGQTMVDEGYYALGGGALVQAASSANSLGVFRWYMEVTDREGNKKELHTNDARVMIVCPDETFEETTDITKTTGIAGKMSGAVYDMNGRKVTEGNMKPGVYIQNGKKFVIK